MTNLFAFRILNLFVKLSEIEHIRVSSLSAQVYNIPISTFDLNFHLHHVKVEVVRIYDNHRWPLDNGMVSVALGYVDGLEWVSHPQHLGGVCKQGNYPRVSTHDLLQCTY